MKIRLLRSRIRDDVGKPGRVEELHGQLRSEVLVGEVRRIILLHEVDVTRVAAVPVRPEPLAAET